MLNIIKIGRYSFGFHITIAIQNVIVYLVSYYLKRSYLEIYACEDRYTFIFDLTNLPDTYALYTTTEG